MIKSIYAHYEKNFNVNFQYPSTKLQEGNVFSSVCLSVHRRVPWSHMTSTHDTLDLIIRPLKPCSLQTWDFNVQGLRASVLPPASDIWGNHWRLVQTCSLQDLTTGADIWWLLKHPRSYWNAFLYCYFNIEIMIM